MFLDTIHHPVFILKKLRSETIGTSSIDWAQLSRFYLKTEAVSSLRKVVFLSKNRTMDNVQKHNICRELSIYSLLVESYHRKNKVYNFVTNDKLMDI
jgi:hypothetical protein